MNPRLPAVLLMDTENLFATLRWQPDDGLERYARTQVTEGQWTEDKSYKERDKNLRWADELTKGFLMTTPDAGVNQAAGNSLRSLITWCGRGILALHHSRPDAISFGHPANKSIIRLGPTMVEKNVRHVDVEAGPDKAELALLDLLSHVEPLYDLFIFGGRDWRVLDRVTQLVEDGWAKLYVFVLPPDARLSAKESLVGTESKYGVLNREQALGYKARQDRFYEFIDVIHVKMDDVRKRSGARPIRRSGGSGPTTDVPWRRLSFAASLGRVPQPHRSAFGSDWEAAATARLGPLDLGRFSAAAAAALRMAWDSRTASVEHEQMRREHGDRWAWALWSAAALLLPQLMVHTDSGRQWTRQPSELAAAAERARRWLASTP